MTTKKLEQKIKNMKSELRALVSKLKKNKASAKKEAKKKATTVFQ